MTDTGNLIQEFFSSMLESRPQPGPLGAIVKLLASGCGSRREIAEALEGRRSLLEEDLLELVVLFIGGCIRDHRLDDGERREIDRLKKLLGIREGSLFKSRRAEITGLIREEIELVLADRKVDREEALYQAVLQDVFDLSYDEYLSVTREAVRRILDETVAAAGQFGKVTEQVRRNLIEQIRVLETFCPLTAEQRKIVLGGP